MDTNFKKEDKNQSQLNFNPDGSISLPESVKKDLSSSRYNSSWKNGNSSEVDEDDFEDLGIFDDSTGEGDNNLQYHLNDNVKGFNLYKNGQKLTPLRFSNSKTQEDIVNEVVDSIKNGKKVIFIKGMCGTGKSALALNIAKSFTKASIVVPGKVLQKQYIEDYMRDKYVLRDDHKKLKIKVITGRENHKCLYSVGKTADDKDLPCKIEINERNFGKIREYLKENPKIRNDLDLKEVKRMSIAPVCPYWSPIVPTEIDLSLEGDKSRYKGLNGIDFTIYNRKKGCSYYNQFNSYLSGNAIIFNSAKYKLEVLMNRKPESDVEIIDECDEFLDSFSNLKKINLNRLLNSLNILGNLMESTEKKNKLLDIYNLVNNLVDEHSFGSNAFNKEPMQIKQTKIYNFLNTLIEEQEIFDSTDEDNYVHSVIEIALEFSDFFDETYGVFSLDDRGLSCSLVTTNLAKKFKDLLDKSKSIVLMSGTIHSQNVLKFVFGLDNFEIIEAESNSPGAIKILETGFEVDCSYNNFHNGGFTRQDYLIALDKSVEKSMKPTLVHVNGFDDLPSYQEKENFNLSNLITKGELIDLQMRDKNHDFISDFKNGKTNVLFTTKCSRGVDFPNEQCRSIIFTKYPNPNAKDVFWKILKKTHPGYYWDFYKDKAKREFLQKIYRGVRNKEDWVYVLSPDKRVLDAVRLII